MGGNDLDKSIEHDVYLRWRLCNRIEVSKATELPTLKYVVQYARLVLDRDSDGTVQKELGLQTSANNQQ